MSAARYAVLVADDNKYVCSSLRGSSFWAELSAEVRAVATSGTEALAIAQELAPQLVVTDIKMPGIDGLTLIEKLKAFLPECEIIVITGYDDFRLAQRALRAGAADLILKPIRESEIERAARRAIEALEAGRRLRHRVTSLEARNQEMSARLEIVASEARRALLADLASGQGGRLSAGEPSLVRGRLRSLKLNLRRYQLLAGMGPTGEHARDFGAEGAGSAAAAAPGGAGDFGGEVIATVVGGFPVWLVDVRHLPEEDARRKALSQLAHRLASARRAGDGEPRQGAIGPVIGVSGVHSGPDQVRGAYGEALAAAEQCFFTPAERVIHFESMPRESGYDEGAFRAALVRFKSALSENAGGAAAGARAGGAEEAREALRELMRRLEAAAPLGLPHAARRIEEIARALGSRAADEERSASAWPHLPELPYRSLEEAEERFGSAVRARFEAARGGASPLESHHLEMVTRYLESNYARELRLTDLARALELSPSHLSRLIRRGTGRTFTELLTAVRVRVATRLLRETNAKVYQIADMVGMRNHAYFHQVFRRQTGKAPNEMRGPAS